MSCLLYTPLAHKLQKYSRSLGTQFSTLRCQLLKVGPCFRSPGRSLLPIGHFSPLADAFVLTAPTRVRTLVEEVALLTVNPGTSVESWLQTVEVRTATVSRSDFALYSCFSKPSCPWTQNNVCHLQCQDKTCLNWKKLQHRSALGNTHSLTCHGTWSSQSVGLSLPAHMLILESCLARRSSCKRQRARC